MADYARFILDALQAPGDAYQEGRAQRMQERQFDQWNQNYARQLGLDSYNQQRDQRVFDYQAEQDRIQNERAQQVYQTQSSQADRNYELEAARTEAAIAPDAPQAPDGFRFTPEGALEPIPGGPADPSIIQAQTAAKQGPRSVDLTAPDKSAILNSDAAIQSGTAAMSSIDRALELNDKAYSGWGAGTRGYAASIFGSEAGQATEEYSNVVAGQALESLRSTFGGNPTEGERKILIDLQGSVNQAPEVRKAILVRAKQAIANRVKFNQEQARALRSGSYYDPSYQVQGMPAGPAQRPDDTPTSVRPTAAPAMQQPGGNVGAPPPSPAWRVAPQPEPALPPQSNAERPDPTSALQMAVDAVNRGAPKEAVRRRLLDAGIEPSMIDLALGPAGQ